MSSSERNPRQNRVTPTGDLIAISARGTLMGNRGCLHDAHGEIRRAFQLKRWIICLLAFKGRRREIMKSGHYTELFFLDEAVALAAGHRPCAECQRGRYVEFRDLWISANPRLAPAVPIRADELDAVLHDDRLTEGGRQRTYQAAPQELPDGTFVMLAGAPHLLWRGLLLLWTPQGYTSHYPEKRPENVTVLTPQTVVNTLRRGYVPAVHESAGLF